jgi:hypothetical protein
MPPTGCLPTVELPDAPLPSPGSKAVQVPRLPRYYQGAMTSCRPFRRASFPSLGDTTRSARVSLARGRTPPRAGLLELVTRYLQPGRLSVETTGSPTFLGNPDCALALLFDPGGTDAPCHCGASARPP